MKSSLRTTRRLGVFLLVYGTSALVSAWIIYLGIEWGIDYMASR